MAKSHGVVGKPQEMSLMKDIHRFEVLQGCYPVKNLGGEVFSSEEAEYCSPDRICTIAIIPRKLLHTIPNKLKNYLY